MVESGPLSAAAPRRAERQLAVWRWLLPVGWLAAGAGYYAPWIAHKTAALTLSGTDMAEFVKFLPAVQSGAVHMTRELFLLPAAAIVVSVAVLVGAERLHYLPVVRALVLVFALGLSLQLLPPAWSPASLRSAEFRVQSIALLAAWLLLLTFWAWGRLPAWLCGSLSAVLAAAAAGCSAWQFAVAKPLVDALYGSVTVPGWGLFTCLTGLALMAVASAGLAGARVRPRA